MDSLTFYFDRNFGRRFPSALQVARPPFRIEYHQNMGFKQEMKDDEWLETCGKKKWVIFTHDDKFQRIAVEAMAIKQHNVAAFSLWGAQLPIWDKICHFAKAYARIRDIIRHERPPYLYRVKSNMRFLKVELP